MRKLREFVCAYCKNPFTVPRKTAKYCSHACKGKAESAKAQIELCCLTCKRLFMRRKSRVRGARRHYCSDTCERQAPPEDIALRFWRMVSREKPQECWPWKGPIIRKGYGIFWLPNKKHRIAHIMAWELTYGPMPQGFQGNHTCDNPPCCNPAHVYPGTHVENMEDTMYAAQHSGRKRQLTDEHIAAIKALIGQKPQKDIATLFGISPATVSAIKHNVYRKPERDPSARPDRSQRIPKIQMRLPL